MSFTAERWAWDQKCRNGVAKSVLVFFGFSASRNNGECYPSIEAIMKATQHTERAVRKAIGQLIAAGLVTREDRLTSLGRMTSPTYRLPVVILEKPTEPDISKTYPQTYPQTDPAPAKTPPLEASSAPAKTQPLGGSSPCENDSRAPAKTQPEPFLEPKKEKKEGAIAQVLEASQQPASQAAAREGSAATGAEAEPEIDRSLEGLSPSIAAIARRNGWGSEAPAEPAPPPVVAEAEVPPPSPAEPPAVTPAKIAASLGRTLRQIAPLPGRANLLTVDEQRDALAPSRRVRAFCLTPEQLAAGVRMPAALGASP